MAKAATYTPPGGGSAVSIRVIPSFPDNISEFGESKIQTGTAVFDVQSSELATPLRAGTITYNGNDYTIKNNPRFDDTDKLIWKLECTT